MPESARKCLILTEVVLVYGAIMAYIWVIRYHYRGAIWWILAWILLSQWLIYRDRLRALGLRLDNLPTAFRETFRMALPCMGVLLLILLVRYFWLDPNVARGARPFPGFYFVSAFVQQYTLQSFFHRRLMHIIPDDGIKGLLVGLIFSTLHIPNPLLIVITFVGGLYSARLFTRHSNLIPLALAHGILGTLLSRGLPSWLIRNMRVGPGYFLT